VVGLGRHVQRSVRAVHRSLAQRAMPNKLSIYIHSTAGYEQALEEFLGFFTDKGYEFKGPSEFLTAEGNTCFLSFDDNFRSWLRTLPILEEYGVRATFYVNSWPFRDRIGEMDVRDYLGRIGAEHETTLSTSELREIAAAGHLIGAHSHTHPVLSALPRAAAQEEIRICREELGSLLGHSPEHFAYPFGMRRHFSRSLRSYCTSIGFTTIANAIPCMQYADSRADSLHRSVWFLDRSFEFNLENVCIDGRVFSSVTGRSAVGGTFS
jgi:peptidoglycan/xylan/chitin deacetylase (PgdA/CDA1 family)